LKEEPTTFEIELIAEIELPDVSTEALARAAEATLEHEGLPAAELSILLSDDAKLAALNKSYRGVDEPTDVLAFPAGEDGTVPEEMGYLGDIAISVPRAREQAAEAGHGVMEELQLLVIHGTLHLLGHDHAEPDEKERMWSAQRAVLAALGLPASLSD
jgi:probable rRNA maturation factor